MNKIFVFGSNLGGRHGKGAALCAVHKFGAKYGVGQGPTGESYAIPTKDRTLRVLPLESIRGYVWEFLTYAKEHPDQEFYVTPVGTGLAGYSSQDIAPMFITASENCILPRKWSDLIPDRKYWNTL